MDNRKLRRLTFTLCSALALCSRLALAQPDESAYVVTYVEVDPASTAEAIRLLSQEREASLKDDGNLSFEALQRIGRPNQFVLFAEWRNDAARDAHSATAHTREFLEALTPLRITPYDERPHTPLSVAAPANGDAALYVVTHVDIVPTQKDVGIGIVKNFAVASRKDPGNVLFDVLTLSSRPNHQTVVEAWSSEEAQRMHAVAKATQEYREALLPLSGSLYDERLYRPLR